MKAPLFLLSVLLGVVLTVHLSMNGAVGAAINNARVGNMLFWVIGAVGAVMIGLTGWQGGALAGLRSVNPVMLTAGLMGATLVFGIAWVIPQIGAGPFTMMLLLGQVVSAMLISHYGLLGSPVQPVAPINVVGALLLLGGAVLATRQG